MKLLTKEEVGLAFSKAAPTYDLASDFQKETGQRLIDRILSDGLRPDKILDVGMGTGRITRELSLKFNRPIHGCDIAWGMVRFSRSNAGDIFAIQADMENLPYKTGIFDVVFSNIAYQWTHNLKAAISEIKRVTSQQGRFYFSILVEDSLNELYKSIALAANKDYNKGLFPGAEYLRHEFREAGFRLAWAEELCLKKYYKDSLELIRRLKNIGAGKIFKSNIFGMGQRQLFFKMLEGYNSMFNENGRVFASYNIFLGRAQK